MFSGRKLLHFLLVGMILALLASLTSAAAYTNTDDVFLDYVHYDNSSGDGLSDSDSNTVAVAGEATVEYITISINFLKTNGTCEAPLAGTPYDNEIVFTLTSPAGTSVQLITANLWPANSDSVGTVTMAFDDAAETSVADLTAPQEGVFAPVGTLASFIGEDPNGDWELFMQDTVGLDPLCVYEWTLNVNLGSLVEPVCGFTAGLNIEVAEDSGQYLEDGWATDIVGAEFVLTTDNDDLFSELPAISLGDAEVADGTLTFTPADETFGVALVTVQLLDEAGEVCQEAEFEIVVLPVNDPPQCDAAFADPDVLWPPNHRMVEITIGGIEDNDSTIFTFVIDSVESNEPENGLGDGNTAPDYEVEDTTLDTGEDTQVVSVRSERSGLGEGRTYTINFTVDDVDFIDDLGDDFTIDDVIDGGTCSNSVTVFVPHDMRNGMENPNASTEGMDALVGDSAISAASSNVTIPSDDDGGDDAGTPADDSK